MAPSPSMEGERALRGNSILQILKIPLLSSQHCSRGLNSRKLLFDSPPPSSSLTDFNLNWRYYLPIHTFNWPVAIEMENYLFGWPGCILYTNFLYSSTFEIAIKQMEWERHNKQNKQAKSFRYLLPIRTIGKTAPWYNIKLWIHVYMWHSTIGS